MQLHIEFIYSTSLTHDLIWNHNTYKKTNIIKCYFSPIISFKDQQQNISSIQFKQLIKAIQQENIYHVLFEGDPKWQDIDWFRQISQSSIQFIIKKIEKCQRFIEYIKFEGLTLTSETMKILHQSRWQFIRVLSLTDNDLSFHEIQMLCRMTLKYLVILDLDQNQICDRSVQILSECKFYYLQELNLSFNPISNKGLKYLSKAQWPKLRELYLDDIDATTHSIRYLAKIKTCQKLYISMELDYVPQTIHQSLPKLGIHQLTILFTSSNNEIDNRERNLKIRELLNVNSFMKKQHFQEILSELKQKQLLNEKIKQDNNLDEHQPFDEVKQIVRKLFGDYYYSIFN